MLKGQKRTPLLVAAMDTVYAHLPMLARAGEVTLPPILPSLHQCSRCDNRLQLQDFTLPWRPARVRAISDGSAAVLAANRAAANTRQHRSVLSWLLSSSGWHRHTAMSCATVSAFMLNGML